jgi:hypothetical protein
MSELVQVTELPLLTMVRIQIRIPPTCTGTRYTIRERRKFPTSSRSQQPAAACSSSSLTRSWPWGPPPPSLRYGALSDRADRASRPPAPAPDRSAALRAPTERRRSREEARRTLPMSDAAVAPRGRLIQLELQVLFAPLAPCALSKRPAAPRRTARGVRTALAHRRGLVRTGLRTSSLTWASKPSGPSRSSRRS